MYKCKKCGSSDVYKEVWININTKEEEEPQTGNLWCYGCGGWVGDDDIEETK